MGFLIQLACGSFRNFNSKRMRLRIQRVPSIQTVATITLHSAPYIADYSLLYLTIGD